MNKKLNELIHECHPDKYLAKGLPLEASVLASNRIIKFYEEWKMIKNIKNSLISIVFK